MARSVSQAPHRGTPREVLFPKLRAALSREACVPAGEPEAPEALTASMSRRCVNRVLRTRVMRPSLVAFAYGPSPKDELSRVLPTLKRAAVLNRSLRISAQLALKSPVKFRVRAGEVRFGREPECEF